MHLHEAAVYAANSKQFVSAWRCIVFCYSAPLAEPQIHSLGPQELTTEVDKLGRERVKYEKSGKQMLPADTCSITASTSPSMDAKQAGESRLNIVVCYATTARV